MTDSILLTGGFGNIGGRFASFLSERKRSHIKLGTRTNRPAPLWSPSAEVVTCSLEDQDSLLKACDGVRTIFHFAALNDRECANDPERAHQVNVIGTENLLKAAHDRSVRHVIYMSTIHVYGSPLVGTFNESSPTNPTHPYGLTHLRAEQVLHEWSTRIHSTIIRSSNGFGFPMSSDVNIWHVIVNDLCRQAVRDRRLTLKSPSNSQRNFITLEDICRALHHVAERVPLNDESIVFNLGSLRSRTLREMAELVAERTYVTLGYRPDIIECQDPISGETDLNFDSSKIRRTGYETTELFTDEIDGILELVVSAND